MTPSAVADLIKRMGYQARLVFDEDIEAKIVSATSGQTFLIKFQPMQEGRRSETDFNCFTFLSLFPAQPGWSAEAANDLSQRVRFIRPYVNELGELVAEWDVYIGSEHLTDVLFARHFKLWEAGIVHLPAKMNEGAKNGNRR